MLGHNRDAQPQELRKPPKEEHLILLLNSVPKHIESTQLI